MSHESTVVPVKGMAIPPRAVDEVAMRKAVLPRQFSGSLKKEGINI